PSCPGRSAPRGDALLNRDPGFLFGARILRRSACALRLARGRRSNRPLLQLCGIEAVELAQELDEGTCAALDCSLALLGRRGARVARGARRVQILAHPAETGRALDSQITERALNLDAGGREGLRVLGSDQVAVRGEHDRRLYVAGM